MAGNLQAEILSTVREIGLNAVGLQVLFMLVKGQGRAWMLGCNNLCWAAIMVPDRLSPSVSPVQSSKQFPGRIQKVAEDSDHFQWQQHKSKNETPVPQLRPRGSVQNASSRKPRNLVRNKRQTSCIPQCNPS